MKSLSSPIPSCRRGRLLAVLAILPALLALPLHAHEWHRHEAGSGRTPRPSGPLSLAELAFLLEGQLSLPEAVPAAGAPLLPVIADPAAAIATSFAQFSPAVRLWWDGVSLHVESDGFPSHGMMEGIFAWQRQMPLPTYYFGTNAWSLPLHPVAGATPLLIAPDRFTQGAIALAADGIPIFNPYNNTGKISAQIGELDRWGGHCGRADDYHYHAAPLHLTNTLGITLPLAVAMDGYPIYGLLEPDGSVPLGLDVVNGHSDALGRYHYHASTAFPYVNGGFHGVVEELQSTNGTGQLVTQAGVQPVVRPVRPSGTPLAGAFIQGFTNLGPDRYQLFYSVPSNAPPTNYWLYSLDRGAGTVTVTYSDASGTSTVNYPGWKPAPALSSASQPLVTRQPVPLTGLAGGTALFTVQATGAPQLQYGWLREGKPLADGPRVAGASTATLALSGLIPEDAGAYSVIVSNTVGATLSTSATLLMAGALSNSPPVFPPGTNRYILSAGEPIVIARPATDPDTPAQALAYTLLAGPAGARIDTATGVIAWTPTPTQAGSSNQVRVVVRDNGTPSLSATNEFSIFVRSSKPNVIIIVTDDQGWHDLGAHGAEIQTPNMDRLGAEGIRLERFYPTPVCSVTRSTLMTGRNPIRTGVNNSHGLDLREHLMPVSFKAAGYQTFMCGKWHLGGLYNTVTNTVINGVSTPVIRENVDYQPQNRGWDVHYGEYTGAINYTTHISQDTGTLDWWLNGQTNLDTGYSTDLLADKAVSLLQGRDPSRPAILYLAFNAVHGPVSATPEAAAKYAALGVTDPVRRTLDAAIDTMDAAMGRVLDAVDSEGIRTNTLVLYFSDNGGELTVGSLNTPLRGTKGDLYEGGIHTPAAIRWPGVLPSGVTNCQEFIWVGDLFPTLCAAAGVAPLNTRPLDGVDLWSRLLTATNGPFNPTRSRGAPLVSGSSAGSGVFDVFTNGNTVSMFKLIRDRLPGAAGGFTNSLFDIVNDPYESSDLAPLPAYAGIASSLAAYYDSIKAEVYPPYIGVSPRSQAVPAGGATTLWAMATSYTKTLSCQWRKDGVEIPGATSLVAIDSSVYLARLDLSNLSPSDAGAYDVLFTNNAVDWPAGVTSAAAVVSVGGGGFAITAPVLSPAAPAEGNPVSVVASASGGTSPYRLFLHHGSGPGTPQATVVFQETMGLTPVKPWTGTLCDNPWQVTYAGANPFSQRPGANSGPGNTNGLEFKGGTASLADSAVSPSSPIDARGTSASVEFWLSANGLGVDAGWAFQVDSGSGFTTRLSELAGSNHPYQLYHYDLPAADRVASLQLRWQFKGGQTTNRIDLDHVSVTASSPGASFATEELLDDGAHQDGAAGDGVFGTTLPSYPAGATVRYFLSAVDAAGFSVTNPAGAPTTTYSYVVAPSAGADREPFNLILGRPTDSSVAISLLASNAITAYLEYGTSPGVYPFRTSTNLFSSGLPVEMTLNGLQPNQAYVYRVRFMLPGAVTLLAGPEHGFHTRRARGSTFTFDIEADPHYLDNTPSVWTQTLTNILADRPDFLIDLGDTFMGEKYAPTNAYALTEPGILEACAAVRNQFFSIPGHSVPLFLAEGNHDPELGWLLSLSSPLANPAVWGAGARGYYYPSPVPGGFYSGAVSVDPFQQEPRDGYYAFEWGDALIVVLDPFWYSNQGVKKSKDPWSWTLGAEQYYWLKATLEGSSAKFKFVFAHHLVGGSFDGLARGGVEFSPYFEWGGLNADGSPGFASHRPGWPLPIRDLLLTNQVQVFFHGHDHLYVKQDYYRSGVAAGPPDLIYQEVPQPSHFPYDSTSYATGTNIDYNYQSGVFHGSSGHLRVTVSPSSTTVDYVRSYRPEDLLAGRTNGMVIESYTIPSPTPSAGWSMLRLPDTGQVGDYTQTFGEDSDYLINPPAYADNGDGTVSDLVTGLMWQKTDGGEMTLSGAMAYPDSQLNATSFAGHADWRLPTIHELMSLLNHDRANPALDPAFFASTGISGAAWNSVYWWSRDQKVGSTNQWCANAGGGVGPKPLTETLSAGGTLNYRVRCVRGAPAPVRQPIHRYVDPGDGTVTDSDTGLMWQKGEVAAPMGWTNALLTAESLVLGGYRDWRLPNIKELESLNDETLTNPSIDTRYFPGAKPARYWSSTTQFGHDTNAWWNEFVSGITSYDGTKGAACWVRAVRGGKPNTPPTLDPIPDQAVAAGRTLQFTAVAADLETAPGFLSFSLTEAPPGASIDPVTGLFAWRAPVGLTGSLQTVQIAVADSSIPALSASRRFTLTALPLSGPAGISSFRLAGGQVQFLVTGDTGPVYTLQTSTNLLLWTDLMSTNPPGTPFLWGDIPGDIPSRFYRVRLE